MARISPPSGNLEKLKLNLLGEDKRKHFIKPAPALVKLHWYKPEKTEDRSQKIEVRSCRMQSSSPDEAKSKNFSLKLVP
jgi:hypothetical protein